VNTTSRWTYSPNGVTTSFAFDNKVLAAGDLAVSWIGSDGNPLVLSSYTVSGVGEETGGTVTFSTAPANTAGSKIVIERHTEPLQDGTFGDFIQEDAATRQERYDRCLLLAQEFATALDRMLLYSPLDADGALVLPPAASRANRALLFDALGKITVGNPLAAGVLVVSSYFQTLLGAANAPALLALLGFSSFMRGLAGTASAPDLLTAEGWSAFVQSIKGATDAAAFRTAIGVPTLFVVGSDVTAASSIDLDTTSGGQAVGDERGVTGTTLIVTIVGTQRIARLTAKSDGVQLAHNAGKIVTKYGDTIVMRTGDSVTLARTGTNEWREIAFEPLPNWKSGNLTVANGTILSPVAHYLGKRVGDIRMMAKCTSNDANYTPAMFAAGEKLELCRGVQQNVGWTAVVSDASVTVQIASSGLGLVAGTAGDGTTAIDPSKWTIWLEIDPRC
jgi:hypothetical protein